MRKGKIGSRKVHRRLQILGEDRYSSLYVFIECAAGENHLCCMLTFNVQRREDYIYTSVCMCSGDLGHYSQSAVCIYWCVHSARINVYSRVHFVCTNMKRACISSCCNYVNGPHVLCRHVQLYASVEYVCTYAQI